MGQGQVGLYHHGAVVSVLRIVLEALGLLQSQRAPVYAVSTVNFLGDELDALSERGVEFIQVLDRAVLSFFAGIDDCFGKLDGSVAAILPVLGQCAAYSALCAESSEELDFLVGVGVELVDADYGDYAALRNVLDVVEEVLAALLEQLQVLLGVFLRERSSGNDSRSAAVHLECADGGNDYGAVRLEAGQSALYVPELLETDVCSEAGLSYVIVEQLECKSVAYDGALSDGDVRERACVYEAGLMLYGVAESRVDGVAHPSGHCACDLEVLSGDRVALLVVSKNDLADTVAKVGQVSCNSKDSHELGGYRDVGAGGHPVAVHLAFAEADLHLSESLAAEVHYEVPLDPLGVDVQSLQTDLSETLVVIVSLVLHTGVESYHSEVVSVHDVVDVAGESKGELGHRDEQSVSAACGCSLNVHGRSAGGLAQASAYVLSELAKTFDKTKARGGLTFSERSRSDSRYFNELSVRLVLETLHDLDEVQLRSLSERNDLVREKAHLFSEPFYGREIFFCIFCDLPVFVLCRIKSCHFYLRLNN